MESSEVPSRVLVVAHKTAATQPLLDAVRERAERGPASFTLLVPRATHGLHKVVDPEDQDAGETQAVIDKAIPLLSDAAGAPVAALVGDADPGAAIQDAISGDIGTVPMTSQPLSKIASPSVGSAVTLVSSSSEPPA